jgi:Mg2+-importing ATPase
LTENQLQVAEIFATDQQNTAFLACAAFSEESRKEKRPNNAFDLALWAYCKKKKLKFETLERLAQAAFDPDRRRNSVMIEIDNGVKLIVRGASEKIIELCRNVNEKKRRELEKWIADQGYRGRRVIAIASKRLTNQNHLDIIKEENDLRFEGLISFVDPIKKSTRATLLKSRALGLQIKILTGDSREVAGAVAYQVGICNSVKEVITGDEFERLTLKQKKDVLDKYAVFARVSPKQKFDIIKLLQEEKQVGFLGEGINDAPALKLANVALVVEGGADVAREAADIILLNRSLSVIIDGIKQGREVFANTVKYIKATLGSNFGNFYAIAAASFLIDFLPMLPLQILLLNLLSDFPMIAIATDNLDPSELKKPKAYNIRDIALTSSIFGAVSALFDFACFALFFRLGPKILQTNWFIESILTELVFLFSIRTRFVFWRGRRPSSPLLILTLAAMIITLAIPFVPVMREIFKFTAPTGSDLMIIFGLVITYFIVTEIIKVFYRKFFNNGQEYQQSIDKKKSVFKQAV